MKTLLVSITGPSGFNKGELVKNLVYSRPHEFVKIVSHTDRPKRDNEEDGVDFHFVSEHQFTNMIDAGSFIEWQRVPSNQYRYGKTKSDINQAFEATTDKVLITRVNIINLPVFKRHFPHSVSIFIDEKDSAAVVEYLRNSKDVLDEEEYERRLKVATEERRRRHLADFIINSKNTDEETINELLKIIDQVKN